MCQRILNFDLAFLCSAGESIRVKNIAIDVMKEILNFFGLTYFRS